MVLTDPLEIRAANARRVLALHDEMTRDWRDLCNEYGELAVELFQAEAPSDLAAEFLAEERLSEQEELLASSANS